MLDLFYRNPRLLALTLLLILAAGLTSLSVLPRAEDPRLTPRFALVFSRYPGASAEQVESQLTERIEEELRSLHEMKTVESTSRTGIAVLQLELDDTVENVAEVWSRVRDKLGDVAPLLPPGAAPPELEEDESAQAYTHVAALVWRAAREPDHAVLRRYGDALEDAYRALPGTEHTHVYGDAIEEVLVEVDVERLSALGLTVDAVAAAVRESDSKVPAGVLRASDSSLLIEVEGEPTSLQSIRSIPVRYADGGQVVRLADVARVQKGVRRPLPDLALVSGEPGVVVAARMAPGLRVDRWAADVRTALSAFEPGLPAGLELRTLFDQSRYVEARFDGLFENLLLGMLAVLAVAFVMMGWRSALLIGAALPLTSLMVLGGMRLLGIPMHQMSVTGLIIALGMMIDNTIIMVDEVGARIRRGQGRARSIAGSVRYLAVPLIGSTLTTVLAFMPLILMPGPAGEFVGGISATVILALLSSLLLALTVTPALAGWLDRLGKPREGRGRFWEHGIEVPRLQRLYGASVGFFLKRPLLGVGFAMLLPLLGFAMSRNLPEQFFPPAERDQFQVQITLPRQASLSETREVALAARDILRAHDGVADVHWFVGTSAPSFYYNMLTGESDSLFFAQAMVQLESARGAREVIREAQCELDSAFPQAQSIVLQLEQGPPFPAPIELRVYGPELERLDALGEDLRAVLAGVADVTHTRVTLRHGHPKLLFRVNEEDARLAGFENADLARRLEQSLEGVTGGSLLEDTEELPIRVRLDEQHRDAVTAVASIDLERPEGGGFVPLSALGEFEMVPEWASVPRRDGRRLTTVQGFITAGMLPNQVLEDFRAALEQADLELPPGYSLEFGGEAAERDEAVGKLMASVGLLVALMGAILVLSFGSFRLAAAIAAVAVLAMGLGMGSLWVFGFPFGFMAIVGTMGLIGVAINDSIVVLAALREDARARGGDPEAAREVVLGASRHVLTTTVTTVAGFLPLILDGGLFWPPLAVAIAGGVLGATVLALYFVPSAYLLLVRRREPQEARTPLPIPALS